MDYRNELQSSYKYKQKRCFWFSGAFNDEFDFGTSPQNFGLNSITFYVPSFELFRCARMKVTTFIKDATGGNIFVIKLLQPYMKFDNIINTDKEAQSIIYINNTGREGMIGETIPVILQPQQINKFVFKINSTVARFVPNIATTFITTTSSLNVATNGYMLIGSQGSLIRIQNGLTYFTYSDGAIIVKSPNMTQTFREYQVLRDTVTYFITNPVSHYRFDSQTSLGNDYFNNYNLTLTGTPSFDSNIYTKGAGSVFISTNNYLRTNSFYNITGKSFTISFWSRRTAINNNYVLFKFGSTGTNNQYFTLKYITANNVSFSNGTNTFNSTSTFSDANTWNHFVCIFDFSSLNVKVYVNNVLQINGTLLNAYAGDNTFMIGYDSFTQYFNGNFDDFRFYEVPLTAAQVTELYQETIAIYTTTTFMLGVEIEDIDLENDNGVSEYK